MGCAWCPSVCLSVRLPDSGGDGVCVRARACGLVRGHTRPPYPHYPSHPPTHPTHTLTHTQVLASSSDDGTARVWDPRTGKAARCIAAFDGQPVANVTWAPNAGPLPGALWASAGGDVFCFDLRSSGPLIVRCARVGACGVSWGRWVRAVNVFLTPSLPHSVRMCVCAVRVFFQCGKSAGPQPMRYKKGRRNRVALCPSQIRQQRPGVRRLWSLAPA